MGSADAGLTAGRPRGSSASSAREAQTAQILRAVRKPARGARVVSLAVLLICARAASTASATTPAPATEPARRPRPRLVWNPAWPRFRLGEYAGTIVVGGTSLYLHENRVLPAESRWQGDNPFDDAIRSWLRADSRAGRMRASDFSDVLQAYAPFVTYLADIPVILAVDRDVGLSWQILMMDTEAYAVAGFITNTLFMTAGRARPLQASCAADPSYDPLCGGTAVNASFPSGHTLTVGTAAGLMCVHHRYLPIYGHPLADGGACALMVLATVTTAVTRVMSDRHWASDTLFGAAVGFGSGYGLPWFLHYRYGPGEADAGRRSPVAVVPFGGHDAVGLELVGVI
jgi:membrane-associated phospholipid phosphatase